MCDIAPLDPAGVGQDQRRAVGGVTGPSVPYTTVRRHLIDKSMDAVK